MSSFPIKDPLTIPKYGTMAQNPEKYPISSNSRTKLNAFRYDDRVDERFEKSPSKVRPQPGHSDKENQTSWLNGVVEPSKSRPSVENPSSQTKEPKSAKECPQTPANRIPLADLISSTEDAVIQDPTADLTPEDHVIWQHVPASSNTDTKSRTPATNSKKRRHSSSPAGSPLPGNSKSARKEPFDLQSFQALLKTPQNDMASDLWNNYVEKHKANGNGNIQLPRFENLLSSSPQTPASAKTSRDSSGLRRSISCNAEWPTSRTKRRKIDDDCKTSRGLFSRTKSNVLDSGKSKSSRINFLIDQIEKSLQKPSDAPSSSSPLPEHKDGVRSRSASPIERRALRASEKSNHSVDEHNEVCKDQAGLRGSSSEFEDEDFDQDLLDFVATSTDPFVETTQSHETQPANSEAKTGLTSNEDPHPQKISDDSGTEPMAPNSKVKIINQNDGNDLDEFEDDYGCLPEHLEEIAAEYDEAPVSNDPTKATGKDEFASNPPSMVAAETPAKAEKAQGMSPGDEFDDDDFDLEAIEQSMNQSGEYGSNHVCHS